jgi:hypothetical protein
VITTIHSDQRSQRIVDSLVVRRPATTVAVAVRKREAAYRIKHLRGAIASLSGVLHRHSVPVPRSKAADDYRQAKASKPGHHDYPNPAHDLKHAT